MRERPGSARSIDRGIAAAEGLGGGVGLRGLLPRRDAGAATRSDPAGARGRCCSIRALPVSEFGDAWPAGVPVQVHGMDADPFFAGEDGDLDAARALVDSTDQAELFLYPGKEHLFADSSLPSYDQTAAALLRGACCDFLEGIR